MLAAVDVSVADLHRRIQVIRMRDRFLDKSLLGYTSLGYRWRPHPSIDADLTGRTALVTGAPKLAVSAPARSINVSSGGMYAQGTRETDEERRTFWSELCRYSGWSGTLDSLVDHE